MKIPTATYRIQFNKDFTFEQLESIIDYLDTLGISTIYASPITRAGAGSLHGYDVTDPHTCNPEFGSVDTLARIAAKLRGKGMSWLQDIVPNHMAFTTANTRLMDVLERGSLSPFYRYFDISWKHPLFRGKLMAPFLGEELAVCIRKKEVQLELTEHGVVVASAAGKYPLSVSSYHLLFIGLLERDTPMMMPPALTHLSLTCQQPRDHEQWQQHKQTVFSRIASNTTHRQQVEALLSLVNSREAWLLELLDKQYYRLCSSRQVSQVINYRRFFTVSSLICLQMEREKVFNDYHRFLHQLYQEDLIQGLRIDHIDGLCEPGQYIHRLRQLFGDDCYLIAEKILAHGEYLPADWLLQGTSGYEFLAYINQLLTNRAGREELDRFYRQQVPDIGDYDSQVIKSKQEILDTQMAGELDNLVGLFFHYGLQQHNDPGRWRTALSALLVHLPVYRIYPGRNPLPEEARRILQKALQAAKQRQPLYAPELDYLQQLFTCFPAHERAYAAMPFLKRLMQYSGPVMAKGVEDTACYRYNALLSHNEVGDTPAMMGMPVGDFHAIMQHRRHTTPLSLNTTATHDTKRGEDARLRLNVLTEMPMLWEQAIQQWFALNRLLHVSPNGKAVPNRNEEYFIYQSILACFPANLQCTTGFIERLQAYLVKALREAKVNSNWESPNTAYEEACSRFIQRILHPGHAFLDAFKPLAEQVIGLAALYSLSQVLIKLTAPGIPDIYQGGELWDLSFVDPDNRRPVDYEQARQYLQQIREQGQKGMGALLSWLQAHRLAGLEKLYVTWKTLQWRREHTSLFTEGEYYPLITGADATVVAYARVLQDQWVVVVAPLGRTVQATDQQLALPQGAPLHWKNLFTGETWPASDQHHYLPLQPILATFPVALLVAGTHNGKKL